MKQIVFKLGELFCGPGGLALGAKLATVKKDGQIFRIEHAWANDIDANSCATYTRNICHKNPDSVICGPVESLDLHKLDPIDVFAFGFPCNDFSVVGEHKGFNGKYGPLYTYGVRVLDLFQPKFFIAENVGGIRSANDGTAFRKILHDLKNAGPGYRITPHLYKFEDYGVPQNRHRVIIVGIEESLGKAFAVPAPTTKGRPVSARKAIERPPISKNVPNNEITAQGKLVVERLKHIRPGQNIWVADLPGHLQLNVKSARMSQIYRRLHPDKPAYTVTGSGGGGTHGYHWKHPRALTNRERARLQTFPDSFVFEGSKESVRKQIGMAVSPKMSELIFTALLKTFAGVAYAHTPSNIATITQLLEEPEMATVDA